MTVYRLDVEKKFGQLHLRLYPQGTPAPEYGPAHGDMKALVAALEEALAPVDTTSGADSVIFRNIAYGEKVALRETVRLSRF
ncbi:MAG: hypothetical protein U1F43_18900 [Myxococcota bacterium]